MSILNLLLSEAYHLLVGNLKFEVWSESRTTEFLEIVAPIIK